MVFVCGPTRPTLRPQAQTSYQVKAEYRKAGEYRLTERQKQQLEREIAQDSHAKRIREKESKSRLAKVKRIEKTEKEEAARCQLGIGLATQLAGYSHSQHAMKRGMEAFVGVKKSRAADKTRACKDDSSAKETNALSTDLKLAILSDASFADQQSCESVNTKMSQETDSFGSMDDEVLLEAEKVITENLIHHNHSAFNSFATDSSKNLEVFDSEDFDEDALDDDTLRNFLDEVESNPQQLNGPICSSLTIAKPIADDNQESAQNSTEMARKTPRIGNITYKDFGYSTQDFDDFDDIDDF